MHPPHNHIESELDEDSNDDDHVHHTPQPGVDDGFFIGRGPTDGQDPEKAIPNNGSGNRGHYPPEGDVPNFPYAPGLNPNVVSNILSFLSGPLNRLLPSKFTSIKY